MSKYYISRILLTVLLCFSVAGYIGISATINMAGDFGFYEEIIEEKELPEKAYEALNESFTKEYNLTLIPAEAYMSVITPEWIEKQMKRDSAAFADYIGKNDKSLAFAHDFAALEESITNFLNEYAESIYYTPDEVFEEKLQETITKAEKKIDDRIDAFYISKLVSSGNLNKIAPYLTLARIGVWVLAGVNIALAAILVLLDQKNGWRRLYFAGTGIFAGGALMTLPAAYILSSGMISSFAIKDPVLYPAVTGIMESAAEGLLARAAGFAVVGLIVIGITVAFNRKSKD